MLRQIADLTLVNHQIDITVNISRDSFEIYDFYKAGEIIKAGENATLKALGLITASKTGLKSKILIASIC